MANTKETGTSHTKQSTGIRVGQQSLGVTYPGLVRRHVPRVHETDDRAEVGGVDADALHAPQHLRLPHTSAQRSDGTRRLHLLPRHAGDDVLRHTTRTHTLRRRPHVSNTPFHSAHTSVHSATFSHAHTHLALPLSLSHSPSPTHISLFLPLSP
jgi:hypothetical protein